ncbi:MAG: amidase [Chloroflexi bacterium]|nr:MAG: amidase [Chloroflexota bacterium]
MTTTTTDPYLTVRELGALLRRRETTPLELTRLYLERLDTLGRRLNALVTLTEERALREAAQAERELNAGLDRGPLHGIPWGAKDLLAADGYPTTWGAAPFRSQQFAGDAWAVARLRDAGAVLVGKLAMIELAGGLGYELPEASITGSARVPWNTDAWAGGSSSGSGSAVAAGLVGFALGSETMGSIVHPAASCGISGLRPTYGRVSRRGAMALSWTMDKIGPMCRSADDCGLVLEAIARHDKYDHTSTRVPFAYWPDSARRSGFRFAVPADATDLVQDDVRLNFAAALDVLHEFGTVETVTLPELPYMETAVTIIRGEIASVFEEFITSGAVRELDDPADRLNALELLAMPAHVYLRAARVRTAITAALGELAGRYDALVSPTLPEVAHPAGEPIGAYFTLSGAYRLLAGVNVAGLPGLSVPNGFGERGLPTALSFVGAPYAESTLIAAANAFQQRTDWHIRRPNLDP